MTNLATGLQFWTEPDNDWDRLVLGGTVWPGVVIDISGDAVARKLDIKKAKGSDKATIKDEGNTNAKFSVTLSIFTDTQWQELQERIAEVHPRRIGGDRRPLQVINPQINLLGINEAYLISIPIPKLDRPKGGPLEFTLGFLEWVPNPKVVKNSSGTGRGNSAGSQGNNANQDLESLIPLDDLTPGERAQEEARRKAIADEGGPPETGIDVDELNSWAEG